MRRFATGVPLVGLVALIIVFLTLPALALVTFQPLPSLLRGVGSRAATDAVEVTLKTNLVALAVMLIIGTPFAYLVGRRRFRGRALLVTLVELPLVMPPAVAGLALLIAYGRLGLLGPALNRVGVDLAFTQAAVVLAILFVAAPFYLRGAIAAFQAVDPTLLDVARTLGAGPLRRMVAVALPLAAPGLGSATALAFARGVGEFGATILFAGSFPGTTQTLPLAVYSLFDVDLRQAVSVGVLLGAKLLPRAWAYRSTSRSPAAASHSASA